MEVMIKKNTLARKAEEAERLAKKTGGKQKSARDTTLQRNLPCAGVCWLRRLERKVDETRRVNVYDQPCVA